MATLTEDQLLAVMPRLKKDRAALMLPHLNSAMDEAEINTKLRMAAFLAQLAHESAQLRYMEEIWGPTDVQKRYEGRKDLGNTQPGDGFRYKGRGPIQLTGRTNYQKAGKVLGLDLEGHPEQAATPEVGFRVAGWYWTKHNLNALADAKNFDGITRAINGGLTGKPDRDAYYQKALTALP